MEGDHAAFIINNIKQTNNFVYQIYVQFIQ